MNEPPRAAVLTVSDGVTHGTREDTSGALAEAMLADAGFVVAMRRVVPDERPDIEVALRDLIAQELQQHFVDVGDSGSILVRD